MTARYPNSFKEFFLSLFHFPSSLSGFFRTIWAQQPYLYVVLGSIFFVIGGYFEVSQRLFISKSIPIAAKVLTIDKRRSTSGFVFRPVLEIKRSDGSNYRYSGNTWMSPNPHRQGDVVQARYSQNSGQVVSIKFIEMKLFLARMFLLLGGGAFMAGNLFLYWIKRKNPTGVGPGQA